MLWLKQSTAVSVKIGPFLDEDDGKTAETGLTIAQADVRLSKNGANIAQKTESSSCTHDELGMRQRPRPRTRCLGVFEIGNAYVYHSTQAQSTPPFLSLDRKGLEQEMFHVGV